MSLYNFNGKYLTDNNGKYITNLGYSVLNIDNNYISFDSNTGSVCTGSNIINVTTDVNNTWTATPDDSWFRINGSTSPYVHTGNGSMTITLISNSGLYKTAHITITSAAPDRIVNIIESPGCSG